jgi:hypothetical protein
MRDNVPSGSDTIDLSLLEDLVESFSFYAITKRSTTSKYCSVLCESNSDRAVLLECGGIILRMPHHTIYV